jgi:hypothetical protein
MRLTTTRSILTAAYACSECLERFDQAYPNIDPDREVSLLDMVSNGINTVQDVIWVLRVMVKDIESVSVDFASRCVNCVSAWTIDDAAREKQKQDLIELLS